MKFAPLHCLLQSMAVTMTAAALEVEVEEMACMKRTRSVSGFQGLVWTPRTSASTAPWADQPLRKQGQQYHHYLRLTDVLFASARRCTVDAQTAQRPPSS